MKMDEIAYPIDDDYKDDSKEILKFLQVEEDDEEEAEENFYDDDNDVAMLYVCSWFLKLC